MRKYWRWCALKKREGSYQWCARSAVVVVGKEGQSRVGLDGIAWFTDVVLLEYLTVLSYQYNLMTGRKPAGKACLIVLIEIEEIMVVLGTKFVNMTHTHFKMGK